MNSMEQIRPKRKDHKRSANGAKWIKQIEYDIVCRYFNNMDDKHLTKFVQEVRDKNPKYVTEHGNITVPHNMDVSSVLWIAKAILKERKLRKQCVRA
jgi:hypothetical protein